MTIATGTKLGPYEITGALGAGGMGEVYRARDTRLERTVAIKVLNSRLVASPESRARFEREAKVVSQLQHPHICVLHDIGCENGTDFLVMEFLDGETLADRLQKGLLPVKEVVVIAAQVAAALDKAHRAGVIHRDLKPGNIMLTKSGAKLMDFGLAKPIGTLGAAASGVGMLTPSTPTMSIAALSSPAGASSPLTQHGSMVGTFQYIAPEVLQGAEADVRSDIFSFGCVLYEMLSGRRAFDGKSQVSVLAAILDKEVEAVAREDCPEALQALVRQSLAKNPEQRFGCAHDLRLQLETIAEAPEGKARAREEAAATPSVLRRLSPWVATAVLVLMAIAATIAFEQARAPKPHVIALGMPLTDADSRFGLALSRDGRFLAYCSTATGDRRVLAIRSMETGTVQTYANAFGPLSPVWSPDGRYVFFATLGKYRKLDVASGAAFDIADAPARNPGSAWTDDGYILLGGNGRGILQVSAAGGKVETLIKPEGNAFYRWPVMVDRNHFLFSAVVPGGANRLMLASRDGKSVREIPLGSDGSVDYSNGYVLFTHGDTLMAQSLHPDGTLGETIHIADHIRGSVTGGRVAFSAAQDGTIVFETGTAGLQELLLLDATGKTTPLPLGKGSYNNPRLSPDGRLVAYDASDNAGNRDIWIYNLALKQATRFSLGGVNSDAVWSPDGKQIAYTRQEQGVYEIIARPSDGARGEQVLVRDPVPMFGRDWSSDGRYFLYDHFLSSGVSIWRVPVSHANGAMPAASEYIGGAGFTKHAERVSRDGKWIVYQSNESGQAQIYLESFFERTGKWQLSTAGGYQPRWVGDNRIYFLSPEDKLMAANLAFTTAGPQVTKIDELFAVPPPFIVGGNPLDVTRDGTRFIFNARGENAVSNWNVLVNWTALVKK